jgi:hypothetical protein
VNRAGGSDSLVKGAVRQVEERSPDALLLDVARESNGLWSVDGPWRREAIERGMRAYEQALPPNRASLARLQPAKRLAIEMALHETTEQRAVDGELSALEAAWREAEEIAGIADNLLPLPGTEDHLEGLRRDGKT